MSDTSSVTYGAWRKSLRDTLTWYVGILTGLGAALAGGFSLAILPKLSGSAREEATLYGGVILFLILVGVGLVLRAQSQRPYPLARLRDKTVQDRLAPYAESLLPWNFESVQALLDTLDADRQLFPKGVVTAGEGPTIKVAGQDSAEDPTEVPGTHGITVPLSADDRATLINARRRIVDFAAGLDLANTIRFVNVMLLVIFLVVLFGLLRLTDLTATPKAPPPVEVFVDTNSPALDGLTTTLVAACASGAETIKASGQPNATLSEWWVVTPSGACSGHRFTVPAAALRPVP